MDTSYVPWIRLQGVSAASASQPPKSCVDLTGPTGAAVLASIPMSLRLDAKTASESTR